MFLTENNNNYNYLSEDDVLQVDFVEPYEMMIENEIFERRLVEGMMKVEHIAIVTEDTYLLQEGIKEFFKKIWEWIKMAAEKVKKFFLKAFNYIAQFVKKLLGIVTQEDIKQATACNDKNLLVVWFANNIDTDAKLSKKISDGANTLMTTLSTVGKLVSNADYNKIDTSGLDKTISDAEGLIVETLKEIGTIEKEAFNTTKQNWIGAKKDILDSFKKFSGEGVKKGIKIDGDTFNKVTEHFKKVLKEAEKKAMKVEGTEANKPAGGTPAGQIQKQDHGNYDTSVDTAQTSVNTAVRRMTQLLSQFQGFSSRVTSIRVKDAAKHLSLAKSAILAASRTQRNKKVENSSYDDYYTEDYNYDNDNGSSDIRVKELFNF